jgi:hypothetical protein
MRKLLFLLLGWCAWTSATAQQADDTKYALIHSRTMFGLSSVMLYDGYLSSVPYSGLGVRFYNEERQYLAPDKTDVSLLGNVDFSFGATLNDAFTSSIMYIGFNYAWGGLYHFKPVRKFKCAAGALIDIDGSFKYNGRNVNNPFNMDASTNLLLAGSVTYDILVFRKILRMKADIRTPMIGCMFVPMRGASYYEMVGFGDFDKAMHFSSLHNKNAISMTYTADIPLKNAVLSLGLSGRNMRYKANDMVFIRNEWTLLFGFTFDAFYFSGRHHQPPSNFIQLDR